MTSSRRVPEDAFISWKIGFHSDHDHDRLYLYDVSETEFIYDVFSYVSRFKRKKIRIISRILEVIF